MGLEGPDIRLSGKGLVLLPTGRQVEVTSHLDAVVSYLYYAPAGMLLGRPLLPVPDTLPQTGKCQDQQENWGVVMRGLPGNSGLLQTPTDFL